MIPTETLDAFVVRLVHWVSLVDIENQRPPHTSTVCGCALSVMLLTLAVVLPHHTTIVVPFKEGTVPGLQPQGGLLREQEGL